MTDRLRISVSGIRGKVPEALDVEVASRLASSFASYIEEGRIAVCRDTRFSSEMLSLAVVAAVLASGLDCLNYEQIPVPFLQYALAHQEKPCSGGIAVSAGHNPLPWNALVLLGESGYYLEATEGPEVFNIFEAGDFKKAGWEELGHAERQGFVLEPYLASLAKLIDLPRLKDAGFKVVADPCNGVVSAFLPAYCDFFGFNLVSINQDPGKPFPHPPEPSPENSSQTEAVVKASGADMGFLLNSDGSRVSFVDEKGEALSEEQTLPLCLLALEGKVRKVVSTVATSSLVEWAAAQTGMRLLRTRVGQSAVTHTMAAEEAPVGGEGSGSLAYLPFSPGYDGLLALTLVLDWMAARQRPLSELRAVLPGLIRKKIRVDVPPDQTYRVMDRLEAVFLEENADITDGIRVERPDAWFIIRPSTTEFILRIMIEGNNENAVESLEDEIRERIGQ
jgi:phosphomannomutase